MKQLCFSKWILISRISFYMGRQNTLSTPLFIQYYFFVSLIQILFDVTVKMLKVFLTWFGQGLKENMFLESGMNRFKVNFLQCIYTQFVKSICHEMKSCAQICSRQKRSVSLVVHLNMQQRNYENSKNRRITSSISSCTERLKNIIA